MRSDIERFIRDLGYDPILHERGHIPYGSNEELESYCYREIGSCDIIVAIIGSRFGSASKNEPHSIAQMELKTALELGKQVYIFIERSVDNEYNTFLRNKENNSIRYAAVDDIRVFHFIEHVRSLPNNNAICGFESVEHICSFLREQWAGLFQRMMQENTKAREVEVLNDMKSTAQTLREMVDFLIKDRQDAGKAIKEIIFANHPIFSQIARLTRTPYRVYFTNYEEMKAWLSNRNWRFQEEWENEDEQLQSWIWDTPQRATTLNINQRVFDQEGKLISFTPTEWNERWLYIDVEEKIARRSKVPSIADELDDDIPF